MTTRADFTGRRRLLSAGVAASLAGCARSPARGAHVVVIGGGFGGATAARYLRLFSNDAIAVTLIEAQAQFVSCPMSNLVVAGWRDLSFITRSYAGLARHGVRVLQARVAAIDADQRRLRLHDGSDVSYDRLIVAVGVDERSEEIAGLAQAQAEGRVLTAWKAGAQTSALARQLAQMPDNGVFVLTVPLAPYRCPPGPYERACLVADYLKRHKPRAKLLVLDANAAPVSKAALFKKAWEELYPNQLEYLANQTLVAVGGAQNKQLKAQFAVDEVTADVINVVPPVRAGALAHTSGLAPPKSNWCPVHWQTMASTLLPHTYVIGDAVVPVSGMPKSGHIANQQAKIAAAAIVDELAQRAPDPEPLWVNTCYSFVAPNEAVHISSAHRFDRASQVPLAVAGAGGLSSARNAAEANFALGWAQNIWTEMLG